MPVIIALANQKGGVGKTTTAVNLGAALVERGYRTVLVDFDPQANATAALGVDPAETPKNVYDLLMDATLPIAQVLVTTAFGVQLIPSHLDLAVADRDLERKLNRERVLARRLEVLEGATDFILIDCPPSLTLLTTNALTAADYVLVPLQTEPFAVQGLSALLNTVQEVRQETNPDLRLLGILLTMYDKDHSVSRQIADNIRTTFKERVFETTIPRYKKLSETAFAGPIRNYAPRHEAVALFAALADEVITRAQT